MGYQNFSSNTKNRKNTTVCDAIEIFNTQKEKCDTNISQIDGINDEDLNKTPKSSTSDDYSEDENELKDIPSSEISGDDIQSSDNDLSELLTYNENLIICKAEKVINKTEDSGLKFKLYLKDGLMRVKGKEYT